MRGSLRGDTILASAVALLLHALDPYGTGQAIVSTRLASCTEVVQKAPDVRLDQIRRH
jgi:hypothetical protein